MLYSMGERCGGCILSLFIRMEYILKIYLLIRGNSIFCAKIINFTRAEKSLLVVVSQIKSV
jgi:hypothetical protein